MSRLRQPVSAVQGLGGGCILCNTFPRLTSHSRGTCLVGAFQGHGAHQGKRVALVSGWAKGSFVNNLNIGLAGLGRAASLRIACVARHTARFAPSIASQSSGPMFKIFPHEPLVGSTACPSKRQRTFRGVVLREVQRKCAAPEFTIDRQAHGADRVEDVA